MSHDSVLMNKRIVSDMEVCPNREGSRVRYDSALAHRVNLLQRHHGLLHNLHRCIIRRHLRRASLDVLR